MSKESTKMSCMRKRPSYDLKAQCFKCKIIRKNEKLYGEAASVNFEQSIIAIEHPVHGRHYNKKQLLWISTLRHTYSRVGSAPTAFPLEAARQYREDQLLSSDHFVSNLTRWSKGNNRSVAKAVKIIVIILTMLTLGIPFNKWSDAINEGPCI